MRRASLGALFGVFAIALAPEARADDTSDLDALLEQNVVSGASKTAETASTAPATSTTITAEDMRRYGIRSLDEAINFLSLGMVTTNPLHSVEIGARGVLLTGDFGDHVLGVINGSHTLNDEWAGTVYVEEGVGMPLDIVDHIEVILGPGSVLYGTGAMLGVLNIVTKRAKDYKGGHLYLDTEIPTSVRVGAGAGSEFSLFGAKSELTVITQYYGQQGPAFDFPAQYGDVDPATGQKLPFIDSVTGRPKRFAPGSETGVWGGGKATQSYWTQVPSVFARLMIGDFDFFARASIYKRATPYLDGLINLNGDFNASDNYEQDRQINLDLSHHATLSPGVRLMTRVYADYFDYHWYNTDSGAEDCLAGQVNGCRYDLAGGSERLGLEIQPTFDWFANGTFVTMLGMDGRLRHVQAQTDITDIETGDNPGSVTPYEQKDQQLAIYGQQTFNPTPWLGLNAGARGDVDPKYDGIKVSPRAALAISPWQGGTLKGIYAEAFRAPSGYESYYNDPFAWATNPDLKPESVRGVEGSFEQRLGAHKLLFGVFRSWWRDMVALQTLTGADLQAAKDRGDIDPSLTDADGVVQYQNIADIDNYGFNTGLEGAFADRRLRYGLNVTGAYSRRNFPDGTSQLLTVGPQFFGNARLSYDLAGLDENLPTLAVAVQYAGRRPADRAFDGGFTPQPFAKPFAELRGTISGPLPGLEGLSYRFTADYAFDDHSPYAIGANQYATAAQPEADLAPVDTFRVGAGLQYDFLQ